MNLLPFWQTILWKSWSNRFAALGGTLAGITGALHGFDMIYPSQVGTVVELYLAGASAFCGIVLAPACRIIQQNFGTDASGNQIVSAIGTAPPGSDPRPSVVIAMPPVAVPSTAPTTTPATVKAAGT